MNDLAILREHLVNLLTKAEAHIDVADELKNFPAQLRGSKPEGCPHTPWLLASWLGPLRRFVLAHLKALRVKRIEFCSAGA